MAIDNLFPNGDAAANWDSSTGATHWDEVNEPIASADDATWIQTNSDNDIDTFDLTPTVVIDDDTVTQVDVSFRYLSSGLEANNRVNINFLIGGTPQGTFQQVVLINDAAWHNVTVNDVGWNSDWTASELAGAQVSIESLQFGMPETIDFFISAVEVVITFTESATQFSASGDLFIKGPSQISTSGDLFINGLDSVIASGDLFIGNRDTIATSGNLFTQGHEFIESKNTDINFFDEFEYLSTGSSDNDSIGRIDKNRFVVIYTDIPDSNHGTIKLGTVSGTTIIFGSESEFDSSGTVTSDHNVSKVDTDKFVIAYMRGGAANIGSVKVGSISGTDITFGSTIDFHTDSTDSISLTSFDTDKIVVAYKDEDDSNHGKAQVGTVSGTDIVLGSVTVFNLDDTSQIHIDTLSPTKFVVIYQDVNDNNHGTAKIGTISGTTITFGSEFEFMSAPSGAGPGGVISLSSSTFVVVYTRLDSPSSVELKFGTVSGTTITYGSPISLDLVSSRSLSKLSETEFVFAYKEILIDGQGTTSIGTISGTNIILGEKKQFLPIASVGGVDVDSLDDHRFVVVYTDDSDSGHGTAKLGTVPGLVDGNLFIQGLDVITTSGDLFIAGQDSIDTSGDLFIKSLDFISVSGDLFIGGKDTITTSGDLFIEGHEIFQASGDLFISGVIDVFTITLSGTLFIDGPQLATTSGDLFIHGLDTIQISGDLFVSGQDSVSTSGDLFIHGLDTIQVSGDLFISGQDAITTSGDLFIKGKDSTTTSGDLFIPGLNTASVSGDLFISGVSIEANTISTSGDLFISGHDVITVSGDLFTQGVDNVSTSGDLYIAGPILSSGQTTLFIEGLSGAIVESGSISLFVNGFEPKPALVCPTLDPTASIQIDDLLIATYQNRIDALINQLGKNVLLQFDPILEDCPNCTFDRQRNRSTGIHTIGGPRPFKRGRKCPFCKGRGLLETPVTKCIKCLVKWNPRELKDFGISIENRQGIVRLKTFLTEMDDIIRAKTSIVDSDQRSLTTLKVRKIRGPVPVGLREDRYCISFWELI